MSKLGNRIKVGVSAIPSGAQGTLTLGSPEDGFFDFAEGGIADQDTVRYVIEEGNDFEIGIGKFTASGTTLSRDTVEQSLISGSAGTTKINASTSSVVFVTATSRNFSYQTAMTLIYGV